jgi:NAD(P)-dependent dehydrogenase (short-subunit alcohol dehydrogenase family)
MEARQLEKDFRGAAKGRTIVRIGIEQGASQERGIEKMRVITMEEKVAVITGAASGIGRAASSILAQAGARMALLDIDPNLGKETEGEIVRNGGFARFFRCDVTSIEECRKTTAGILEEFGRIDILFNNAGKIIRKNTVDLKEEEWDLVVNVNLKSIFLLSRFIIPVMKKGGGGSIINTGSGWGPKCCCLLCGQRRRGESDKSYGH